MQSFRNSAALIVSIGKRLENCARNAVLTYAVPQAESSGIMVTGSSLECSREDGSNVRLIATPLDSSNQDTSTDQIDEVLDVYQIDFMNLKEMVNVLWEDFREHAYRTRQDPERIGIARDQILILADAWDPLCSYFLLPVMYSFKNLVQLAGDQTDLNVVLDISHFKEEAPTIHQESLVYRLVYEISERIDPAPRKIDDPILKKLGFNRNLDLRDIGFYIIDDKKERNLFAEDHQEIEDIVLSFTLGMVSPEVRSNLSQSSLFENLQPNRRFFSSFGSVGMIYDPEKIIDYCGLKLANKIVLEDIMQPQTIQAEDIKKKSSEVIATFGKPVEWFNELITKPPFSIDGTDSKTWNLRYAFNEILYTPPSIDKAAECPFLTNIEAHYQKMVNETSPGIMEIMLHNARIKASEILTSRKETINQIYSNSELFPNLFTNLESTLKFIQRDLQIRKNDAQHKVASLDDAAKLDALLEDSKKNFREALIQFRPLPTWYKYIPEGAIKDLVDNVFTLLQRSVFAKLDKIRIEIELLTARLISLPYEKALAEFNLKVAEETCELIEKHEEDLSQAEKRLKTIIENNSVSLDLKWDGFSTKAEEFDFLFDPITQPIVEALFKKYQPATKQVGADLLANRKWFLNGKPDFTADAFNDLLEFSEQPYHFVRDWDLARVINEHYVEQDLMGNHRTIFASYLNKIMILLTYTVEAVGESPNNPLRYALQSADGEDFWEKFFAEQPQSEEHITWNKYVSPSPYFASFIKILNGIAYAMIEHLFEEGRAKWEALSEEEQADIDIIPRLKKKPDPVIPSPVIVDPPIVLPDGYWSLICEWDFTPEGSSESIHFEVPIRVAEANYTELFNRQRHREQFQLYAEEACDEVDQLVSHFRDIHSRYNWDSYTQASNVLAFVQCFIPYHRDIDTKNLSDYARYPLETLWDQKGDCEDVAILCAAILTRLGLKVALLGYPGHLAFGVETSSAPGMRDLIRDPNYPVSYYYGESTSKYWKLGQIPDSYQWTTAEFFRVHEANWKF